MWQTITFFFVVNVISAFMTWSKSRENASLKVSKFNQILYTFFGGALGVLLLSALTKKWDYKLYFIVLAVLENIGVYIVLYELAVHVAN